MTNLYKRLFTYRERENRSPLEDFLSEALADLLNRLPDDRARACVALMLGGCAEAIGALACVWPEDSTARWSTQAPVGGGRRADLLMEVDGQKLLIVENKIAAGFQEHEVDGDVDAIGERGTQDQLATYGQWLAGHSPRPWGGALVLLTHWTPAPAGFGDDDARYRVRHRVTLRWSDLSRWLAAQARTADSPDVGWAMLARDLVVFLKEQNMDSDIATGRDWAALQVYLASADRVRNSVERVWEGAKAIWAPICQSRPYPLEVSTEYACVWKYRYLSRTDLREAYLAAGVRYPEAGGYLSEIATDESYWFVEVGDPTSAGVVTALTMPTDWRGGEDVWLACQALQQTSGDADAGLAAAESWVRKRIAEVAAALQ